MTSDLRPALVALVFFSALTGVAYPIVVTAIGAAAFSTEAHGSLLTSNDTVRGSAFVGQAFASPGHLWSRPSAISRSYDARSSSGSNLGPTNPALGTLVRERIAALRAADPASTAPVPVELVTASGSGLDPHLSPAAALYQVRRIARARGVDSSTVARIIARYTESRTFGLLGEPRVNVLRVNLALDSLPPLTETSRR